MQARSRNSGDAHALRRLLAVLNGLAIVSALGAFEVQPDWRISHRQLHDLAFGWRFHLGDPAGAEAIAFDDAAWKPIDLPHDWSIAGPRSPDASTGMGGGYAPAGVGWYRKTIDVPPDWKGRNAWVVFEGVYMNAQVWLNGQSLGVQRYGYSTFRFEITRQLKPGARNVLAVRVDNSAQPNSRWYSGSGIYRPVWIEVADPVHIAPNGVVVQTVSASTDRAALRTRTTVSNDTGRRRRVEVEIRVLPIPERDAQPVALATKTVTLEPQTSALVLQELALEQPKLWSPDTPTLYTLSVRATSGKKLADVVETRFGIRTIRVSPERGFELNGASIKLIGANVHHDHGPLGAASYRSAEYRRVRLLKEAGFDAVRTSHNPPAPAFLDACDELGLLVMDEAFDCWEQGKNPHDYSVWFKEWWPRDLDAMILRDRNHPSVVFWSIGNEIQEVGKPEGHALARAIARRVRELDPTRPVAIGLTVPWIIPAEWTDLDPAFASVDVAGYNYQHHRVDEDHARVPSRVMVATESYQADTFAVWDVAQKHPFFLGDFVWTGIDYLGESGIGRVYPPDEKVFQHWETEHWPWYGAYCGDIDITGWRKPISHYRNIVWDRGEKLYMAVQEPPPTKGAWQPTMWGVPPTLDSWTWPGHEDKPMIVEVYSRHDSVRLFLNDELIGEKPTTRAEQFKAVFEVPYRPGHLRVVGITDGRDAETRELETAGPAVGVRLRPDWGAKELEQTEPAFAIAEIVDAQGRVVPTSSARVQFSVGEGSRILAVATGDLTSPEPFVGTSRQAWHGRVLVVVEPGEMTKDFQRALTITASVPELGGATDTLRAQPYVILSP